MYSHKNNTNLRDRPLELWPQLKTFKKSTGFAHHANQHLIPFLTGFVLTNPDYNSMPYKHLAELIQDHSSPTLAILNKIREKHFPLVLSLRK